MSNRYSQCHSLACLRLDSRFSISLYDSNHFICDTSPLFCLHGYSLCACSISANSIIIGYLSDCLDRLATARERTSSRSKSLSLPLFPFNRGEVLPATFSPPHLLFFSTLLCLLSSSSSLPSLLSSSHLSLHSPPISVLASLLPCSRNSAAPFGSLSSAILSTCPAHCNLLLTSLYVKLHCTPASSFNSNTLRLSALVTLVFSPDLVVCAHLQPVLLSFGLSQGFRSVQTCWCDTSAHDLAFQSF